MKSTLKNRIKLWWHCLTHFHREAIIQDYNAEKKLIEEIYCDNCGYGK